MDQVIGIISSSCRSDQLSGLAKDWPIAAVPIGSRYRLLDFALSNMVNSGVRKVGLITPYNYWPLLQHLGAGKEWFLDRKIGGLSILPGFSYGSETTNMQFLLKDLALNMDFLKKDEAEHVIISGSNLVVNINYQEVLVFHKSKDADITLIYKEEEIAPEKRGDSLYLEVETSGRVKALIWELFCEGDQKGKRFLDMIMIKKKLLLEILEVYDLTETTDLLKVVVKGAKELKAYGFQFKGYLAKIDTVESYFNCSMELLKLEIRRELFMGPHKIHTKIADHPPTQYGLQAAVRNSLVASGCRINGQVENSILFQEVYIESGAIIHNSIIMQKSRIGRDVMLKNVILDKLVRIRDGTVIKGERNQPIVMEKRAN